MICGGKIVFPWALAAGLWAVVQHVTALTPAVVSAVATNSVILGPTNVYTARQTVFPNHNALIVVTLMAHRVVTIQQLNRASAQWIRFVVFLHGIKFAWI